MNEPTRSRRPRDRKSQLAAVAAELFRARGYDGVGINDIAAAAGVTGPALYRHFSDKQAVLGHVLLAGLGEIERATDEALTVTETPSPERIRALLTGLATSSVERRDIAALWRWEGTHLDADDQRAVRERSTAVLTQWAKVVLRLRPELAPDDAELLCWAVLSVFGSVSLHHTSVAKRRFGQLLVDIALRVLHLDLPEPAEPRPGSDAAAPWFDLGTPSRKEQLLTAAAELFRAHGFTAVSIEDIGRAAGIAGPSVYRHFPSKAALFGAIARRAADRLALAAEGALRTSAPPDERTALARLADSYVRTLTGPPDLLVSFSIDRVHVEDRDRGELLRVQRDYVSRWVRLLEAARPELGPKEARITVHAALAIANDLARTRRVSTRPQLADELVALVTAALGVG